MPVTAEGLYAAKPELLFLEWTLRWVYAPCLRSRNLEGHLLGCIRAKAWKERVLPPKIAIQTAQNMRETRSKSLDLFVRLYAGLWTQQAWDELGIIRVFRTLCLVFRRSRWGPKVCHHHTEIRVNDLVAVTTVNGASTQPIPLHF
jgi:hypothetical protein